MEKQFETEFGNYKLTVLGSEYIRILKVTPIDRTKPHTDIHGYGKSDMDVETYFKIGTSSPGVIALEEMEEHINTYNEAVEAVKYFRKELVKNGFEVE